MSALERLEAVSGISVYKKLASKLPSMVSTLYTDTRDMFQEWISGVRPPTWQTLLVNLLGIDDLLAKAIEDFLHPKTQMASQVPNYCCCLPIAMVQLLLFTNSYGTTIVVYQQLWYNYCCCLWYFHNSVFSSTSCGKVKKLNSKPNQKVGLLWCSCAYKSSFPMSNSYTTHKNVTHNYFTSPTQHPLPLFGY